MRNSSPIALGQVIANKYQVEGVLGEGANNASGQNSGDSKGRSLADEHQFFPSIMMDIKSGPLYPSLHTCMAR